MLTEKTVIETSSNECESLPYRAFLLRCWQEKENGNEWRFSLEQLPENLKSKKAFATVDELITYLSNTLNV